VEESIAALKWLREQGAERFYVKYCSTFDSTPTGNIGPICDASMEFLQTPYTVLCPALPVNGRVVRGGRPFVNGVPLEQSPMKNHPLTPMWASSIEELMEPQSKYPCRAIGRVCAVRCPGWTPLTAIMYRIWKQTAMRTQFSPVLAGFACLPEEAVLRSLWRKS
jgi:uncharacterized protein YgbK (DUF1537 family)